MKITVLGAGPAGLAAGYYLNKKGYNDITIIDKENVVGGCCRTRFYKNIPYEFGPQILFTNKDILIEEFNKFLTCYSPPSLDKEYHYYSSVNGKLDDLHDFPVTTKNVLKFENANEIIYELYNLNLDKPDFSNFENYCLSRVGKTLYETYIKNYNIKAWKIHPKEMDTDWVKFRPLTLQAENTRFKNQWQGHPGNYNPMWDTMAEKLKFVQGDVEIRNDCEYFLNGEKIESDVIISTLSLSKNLEFIDTYKVFVVLKGDEFVSNSAFTTFPNNYSFVRMFDYRQQYFVESDCTLLDFAIPYRANIDEKAVLQEVTDFCRNVLKREVIETFIDNREKIYPLATRQNMTLFNNCLDKLQTNNIIPTGRAGLHAYVSKDTCIFMGMNIANNFESLLDNKTKLDAIKQLRQDLH